MEITHTNIKAKAFRTFITVYFLFKSKRLSANIKLTLHKALIRSAMTDASPACEICGRHPSNEIVAPSKQGSQQQWQISKVHTGSRIAHSVAEQPG
jgi:hypothetical protein